MSPSQLSDHLGYWMRSVSNAVSHAFARQLEASGVTVAEWVVLREMYGRDGTIAPSEIADLTGLSRGAISKLVDRLQKKHLLLRADSQEDGRRQRLRLSAKGRALVPRLAQIADRNDEVFFASLSANERDQLRALLQKLAAAHEIRQAPLE